MLKGAELAQVPEPWSRPTWCRPRPSLDPINKSVMAPGSEPGGVISGVLSLVLIGGMLVASAAFVLVVLYVGYLVLSNPGSSKQRLARQSRHSEE